MTRRIEEIQATIQTGFDLIEEVDNAVGEGRLPDDASEYTEGVNGKLQSVDQFIKDQGRVTEKQADMIENIVRGLENWTQRL